MMYCSTLLVSDGSTHQQFTKRMFERLRGSTLNSFPMEEKLRNGSNQINWDKYINAGEHADFEMIRKGVGRCTCKNRTVTKDIETENTIWKCCFRTMLDGRIACAVAAIRLYDNSKEPEMTLYTPKTESGWLLTSRGQQIHCSFPSLTAKTDDIWECVSCFLHGYNW